MITLAHRLGNMGVGRHLNNDKTNLDSPAMFSTTLSNYNYTVSFGAAENKLRFILAIKIAEEIDPSMLLLYSHALLLPRVPGAIIVYISCNVKNGIYCQYVRTGIHTKYISTTKII